MFISFEGIEGCGKSTQARRLAAAVPGSVLTFEPGDTPLGRGLRELLLARDGHRPVPEAEVLMFFADRAQHVSELIRPALAAGRTVVCDRYTDSSLAYQGYGRDLPIADLLAVARLATGGLWPDLTLLLDVTVDVGLARVDRRGAGADRLESERRHFHERVRQGYLAMAADQPGRWVVVDGGGDPDTVEARVREAVRSRLGNALGV